MYFSLGSKLHTIFFNFDIAIESFPFAEKIDTTVPGSVTELRKRFEQCKQPGSKSTSPRSLSQPSIRSMDSQIEQKAANKPVLTINPDAQSFPRKKLEVCALYFVKFTHWN